jgi:hypothetical protein
MALPGNTEFDRRLAGSGMPFAACCYPATKPAGTHRAYWLHRPIEDLEGRMSTDLQFLEEWIPERMDPGTVFVLENQAKLGHAQNPFVAVMSCPRCGTLGLITRRQLCGGETMICGGDVCSAEYRLEGENICYRRVQ